MAADSASGERTVQGSAQATARLRYAVKTALALTLAYLLPMALGWPQPQTAATTVMLIAAAGAVSDSLQKGVLRIIGTVAGAVIGLSLIAMFPQERMLYLLSVSAVVSVVAYLYNAYQGDSTAFMLPAVVTLMVFNGGDADGAFLYGVDRAFMTVFGVIVYTVVASLLWPVRVADNTRAMAAELIRGFAAAFHALGQDSAGREDTDKRLAQLLTRAEDFHTHFAAVRGGSGLDDYAAEWRQVAACLEELQEDLVPALQRPSPPDTDFARYIDSYPVLLADLDARFTHAADCLQGAAYRVQAPTPVVEVRSEALADCNHRTTAEVRARADLLQRLQDNLAALQAALDSMLHDRAGFRPVREPSSRPAFIWLDLEHLKTALRAFVTFWIASAIWIQFNPPGGFMFVTFCTVLVPLVSFTPATPKLLIVLLSLGFLFAFPAYVFLLPQLTHWLQLGAFLFVYAFLGFFIFAGPVSIFFLLGLFTLGIQNSMSYHVDGLLSIMLMFYLVCATLVITMYFPFSSRPEILFDSLRRRFFRSCARTLRQSGRARRRLWERMWEHLSRGSEALLLAKLLQWGARIDPSRMGADTAQSVQALNHACELLHAQVQVVARRADEFTGNPLVAALRARAENHRLAQLCATLASRDPAQAIDAAGVGPEALEAQLDDFLGTIDPQQYEQRELGLFYVYLGLQASLLDAIMACRQAQDAMELERLAEPGF